MAPRTEPLFLSQPPFSDLEVQEVVDAAPRQRTYSELAAELVERFGPDRAWSADEISRYWNATRPIRSGRARAVEDEPDIRAFVDDRLGRLMIEELAAACRDRFGERAPSRSSIARYWRRLRTLYESMDKPGNGTARRKSRRSTGAGRERGQR